MHRAHCLYFRASGFGGASFREFSLVVNASEDWMSLGLKTLDGLAVQVQTGPSKSPGYCSLLLGQIRLRGLIRRANSYILKGLPFRNVRP
jgi:hypothetical protein